MLTQRKIERLTKPGRYRDGLMPGLYLVVGENGARSWVMRYELRGRERMMGLGAAATFSLREARERARAARQLLVDGIDPLEAKRAAKVAAELAAAKNLTFAEAAKRYVIQHEAKWTRSHRDAVIGSLRTYANPIIGNMNVSDIDTAAVLRVIEPHWIATTETIDRTRSRIEAVLDWAAVRGHRTGDNPARWKGHLDQVLPAKSEVAPVKHHPAMPYAELPTFMAELRAATGIGCRALEFAILTAARTGEVVGARWSEVDLDAATWIIPAERMKAGREHRVPLSVPALELLRNLPGEPANDHVFIGRKPGIAMSDMGLNRALRTLRSGSVVVHGFRSTFRDWCAEQTAYPSDLIEIALAHFVGNKVEQAYRRGDMLAKRARLMADWGTFCSTPSTDAAEVIPIWGAAVTRLPKPPFHASNEAEREEMRVYILSRLCEEEYRGDLPQANPQEEEAILKRLAYKTAKSAARRGNLAPLAKHLTAITGDSEIAAFLRVPARGRGKRKDQQIVFFSRYSRWEVIDTVRRIRQIWRDEFGKVKRDPDFDDSAEKIASKLHGLSEDEVQQIMKHSGRY